MGTTNRPLTIWVQAKWAKQKEVKALIEKGHSVQIMDAEPDLIIHENAWRWHDAYWEHIEVALKEARRGQPVKRAVDGVKTGAKPRNRKGPKPAAAE